ncbi:MAG TPA: BrxA/BrxB family bacilliredoxin, partial [Candidatus Krumholzibacteria bacterium]|nr:BrxA/BrxB family bacilliredoxin [Candidatus Krumholzibacteria bacterium]
MPYPELMVAPMRAELADAGILELRDAAAVDAFFAEKSGTALLLINSVCGCAAGSARPAVRMAMDHAKRPDRFATVFAGQDLEATARARVLIGDVPPSSPSIAVFKDGELVHFVPRHLIEGQSAQLVARELG